MLKEKIINNLEVGKIYDEEYLISSGFEFVGEMSISEESQRYETKVAKNSNVLGFLRDVGNGHWVFI